MIRAIRNKKISFFYDLKVNKQLEVQLNFLEPLRNKLLFFE